MHIFLNRPYRKFILIHKLFLNYNDFWHTLLFLPVTNVFELKTFFTFVSRKNIYTPNNTINEALKITTPSEYSDYVGVMFILFFCLVDPDTMTNYFIRTLNGYAYTGEFATFWN